ncbi:MAG: hypothetical protein QM763_19240 [Agriterribacter sp.]
MKFSKEIQKSIIVVILFFIKCTTYGQELNNTSTLQNMYVQTDRSIYSPGETVWFKSYLSTFNDAVTGSNLFVELYDTALHALNQTICPVINAAADGSITIPKTAVSGQVFLSVRLDNGSRFVKPLFININPHIILDTANTSPVFFPEGGKLVYNTENYIAFTAGYDFYGVIKNNIGDSILSVKAGHEGMGSFKIIPEPGKTYFCHWKDERNTQQVTALPAATDNGIALHVQQVGNKLYYVLNKGGAQNSNLKKIIVRAAIDGRVFYSANADLSETNVLSSFIPLQGLPSAVVKVLLFDNNDNLVAERAVFINNKEFYTNPGIFFTEKNLSARGRNNFQLDFKDSQLRNISISIADAGYTTNECSSSILPNMFLNNTIAGIIKNADEYFTDTTNYKEKMEELDLLLLSSAPQTNANTSLRTLQTGKSYITLTGVVQYTNGKPYAKSTLISIDDTTGRQLYKVTPDGSGYFTLNGLVFYDTAKLQCKAIGGKGEQLACSFTVSYAGSGIKLPDNLKAYNKRYIITGKANEPAKGVNAAPFTNDTLVFAKNGVTLKEVKITADPVQMERRRLEAVEKRHTTGVFSAYKATAYSADMLNDPMAESYFDVFNYITSRIPQLAVVNINGHKELVETRAKSSLATKDDVISDYYLDESKTEQSVIEQLNIKDIAFIKYIPKFGGLPGLPPVVSIYLKKSDEKGAWEKEISKAKAYTITGYPTPKDFYSPDYSKHKDDITSDYRKTLLWQPYVKLVNGKADITFYNNDVTKKIKIIAEGITDDGRPVYFEKVIE